MRTHRVGLAVIFLAVIYGCDHKDDQRSTLHTIRDWAHALDDEQAKSGQYPVARSITELIAELNGSQLKSTDAWGRELRVTSCTHAYVIWSPGRDGLPDAERSFGAKRSPDADLIWGDRGLWTWFEGPSDGSHDPGDPFIHVRETCGG